MQTTGHQQACLLVPSSMAASLMDLGPGWRKLRAHHHSTAILLDLPCQACHQALMSSPLTSYNGHTHQHHA